MEKESEKETFTFDYVIVGAGPAAMGLLLGMLSPFRDCGGPPFSIGVIERGKGPPHDSSTVLLRNWYDAAHNTSTSAYVVPGTARNQRVMDVPIGMGLGGTSNINAGLCIPPAADDFESWPVPWRDQMMDSVHIIQRTLAQNDCLQHCNTNCNPLFFQKEDSTFIANKSASSLNKSDTPWRETKFPSLMTDIPILAKRDSYGRYVRINYYQGLLEPLLAACPILRDSIHWFQEMEAQRLIMVDGTAVGVECQSRRAHSTAPQMFHARKDIILCAGAIESPALLQVSGIGHHQDLEAIGIPPIVANYTAGVGRSLKDHVLIPRAILTRPTWSKKSANGVKALFQVEVNEKRFQLGLMDSFLLPSTISHTFAALLRSTGTSTVDKISNRLARPLEIFIRCLLRYTPIYLLLLCFKTVAIFLLNPVSEGKVTIRPKGSTTSSPLCRKDVEVDINLGYLKDDQDLVAMALGLESSSEFCDACFPVWLDAIPGLLRFLPRWGLAKQTTSQASWFSSFCKAFCCPYFHWCSTCSMQRETLTDEWVVDASLRVRQVASLRVCDASVFPSLISAPTALTSAALGYLFGSSVLLDSKKNK